MSVTHNCFPHPGTMGVSLAATAINTRHKSYWASSGRSQASRQRAATNGLLEVPKIEDILDRLVKEDHQEAES